MQDKQKILVHDNVELRKIKCSAVRKSSGVSKGFLKEWAGAGRTE